MNRKCKASVALAGNIQDKQTRASTTAAEAGTPSPNNEGGPGSAGVVPNLLPAAAVHVADNDADTQRAVAAYLEAHQIEVTGQDVPPPLQSFECSVCSGAQLRLSCMAHSSAFTVRCAAMLCT